MEEILMSLVDRIFWVLTALFFFVATFKTLKHRIIDKIDASIDNIWLRLGMVCMAVATILQMQ